MVAPAFVSSATVVKPQPTHFYFLDGLRGIASLWVVFFHVGADSLPALAAAMPSPLRIALFEKGSLGVAIFFVLSGFVISYSLRKVTIDRNYLTNFTLRRWVRLSPPYYASIVVGLAITGLATHLKGESLPLPSLPVLVGHLLYLQDVLGLGHINDVYWTLCLEMQFYLLFCGLLWFAQRYSQRSSSGDTVAQFHQRTSQLLFLVGGCAAAICPLFIEAAVRPVWFIHQVYAFLLGVFAYWCWAQRLSPACFYSYSAVILAGAVIHQDYFAMTAVGTAIGLLKIAQLQCLGQWLAGPVMQFLGRVSYSLYLIHVPIAGGVIFVGRKALGTGLWVDTAILGGAIVASLVAATVLWWLTECPSIAWSKRLKPKPAGGLLQV